jgi:hypothetical protein
MRTLLSGLTFIALVAAAAAPAAADDLPVPDPGEPCVDAVQVCIGEDLGRSIAAIILGLINMKDDNAKREEFVKESLDATSRLYPGYNIVIVHNGGHTVSPPRLSL